MGVCCNMQELDSIWNLYPYYPVISTIRSDTILGYFEGYEYISLGELLSSALLKYEQKSRKEYVLKELDNIFNNLNLKKIIVDNIDILFNPKYKIDVLGYFPKPGRNRGLI